MNPTRVAALLTALLPAFVGLGQGAPLPQGPVFDFPKWKTGDSWDLGVVLYPRNLPPGKDAEFDAHLRVGYRMQVRIEGQEKVPGADCWKIAFLPGADAPARIREQRCVVLVDTGTGWPRQIRHGKEGALKTETSRAFGYAPFSTSALEGFPVEIFPFFENRMQESFVFPGGSLFMQKEQKGENTVLKANYIQGGQFDLVIQQKWAPGTKWWTDYDRRVKGKRDLYAKVGADPVQLTTPVPYRDPKVPPPPAPPPSDPNPLRNDIRLRVPLTVEGNNPKLADILRQLEKATGLRMMVAEALAGHDPAFGYVALRDTPAWSVMMMLAQA
jgi:hypothetical protein